MGSLQRFTLRFHFLLLAILALGCSADIPPMSEVTGLITIQGKPLPEVAVMFLPNKIEGEKRPPSSAITDSEGRYSLIYSMPNPSNAGKPSRGSGAVLGSHRVVVTDYKMMNEMLPPPGRIPKKFHDEKTTPLKFEVIEGQQTINIALD